MASVSGSGQQKEMDLKLQIIHSQFHRILNFMLMHMDDYCIYNNVLIFV